MNKEHEHELDCYKGKECPECGDSIPRRDNICDRCKRKHFEQSQDIRDKIWILW